VIGGVALVVGIIIVASGGLGGGAGSRAVPTEVPLTAAELTGTAAAANRGIATGEVAAEETEAPTEEIAATPVPAEPVRITADNIGGLETVRHVDFYPGQAVGWSPDGTLIASGTLGEDDDLVFIYDVETGELVQVLDYPDDSTYRVTPVRWSPDGLLIAAGGDDGTGVVWDWASGEELFRFDDMDGYNTIGFSPDGYEVVVQRTGGTEIWDLTSGTLKRSLALSTDFYWEIAWSPLGDKIAASFAAIDTVLIWDAATGEDLFAQDGDPTGTGIVGLAWSPDGKLLAGGSENNVIYIWDVDSQQTILTVDQFEETEEYAHTLEFSPDGYLLAVTSNSGFVYFIDVATGEMVHEYESWGPVMWSPDGTLIFDASIGDFFGVLR
jgi:WD40 repeat protein